MDESGFESETIRPCGYAPIGSPCIGSYNWQAKERTNVIGALYGRMLFALDCLKSNINKEVFYHWCKFTLIPKLKKKCVIVMDNATFHKRVQKLLNRHGHRLLFLPPYSPDLNPIEKKWAQVKFLRQGWMENDLSKLFYDIHPNYNSFVVQWLYWGWCETQLALVLHQYWDDKLREDLLQRHTTIDRILYCGQPRWAATA